MRKIYFLLSILISLVSKNFVQDSVSFRMHYLPEHNYYEKINKHTKNEINFSGPDNVMKVLTDKKVSNPLISDKESNMELNIITGKQKDTSLTLIKEIFDCSYTDGTQIIPKGTKMYGRTNDSSLPMYDSVSSTDTNTQEKKRIIQTAEAFSEILLPNKKNGNRRKRHRNYSSNFAYCRNEIVYENFRNL